MLLATPMKKRITILLLLLSLLTFGQTDNSWKKSALTITPEVLFGKTKHANKGFPDTGFQEQFFLSFGRNQTENPQEWAYRLKRPKTGLSIGVTEIGHLDTLGIAFTAIPFIEFKAFGSNRFKIHTGAGGSYFTKKYHPETNPLNRAVTTHLTWSVRLNFYYQFLSTPNVDWRAGLGYAHHSNGHMRLMNIGYNSFLVSLSADIKNPFKHDVIPVSSPLIEYEKTVYDYFTLRGGLGANTFAYAFNDKRGVYSVAVEYGNVYNNTLKVGIGFYYRFYQHYYDYIKGNESLVQPGREFDYFQSNPWFYSTNIGFSVNAEFLLNHVGIDFQLGYDFHKPGYKIDYRINDGWENTPRDIPTDWVLGSFDSEFKKKYRISSRIALKYYLIGLEKAPKHNIYIGAFIHANLGQADFSELGFGYVHSFNYRKK